MKTSYLYLALSFILIAGVVSLGGQSFNKDNNDTFIPYELKLSSEGKVLEQIVSTEYKIEPFVDEKLEMEDWMTDPIKWTNCD